MSSWRVWRPALLFAGLLCIPGLALAQPAGGAGSGPSENRPEQADDPVEQARRHFETGLRLTGLEHWEAALLEFSRSLELHPTPSAALNRALCLQRLQRYAEAFTAFRDLLARHAHEMDAAQRARVERILGEMRSFVAPVTIAVDVEGATVVIDDREVGESPLREPVLLLSGVHQIEVRRDGYVTARRQVPVVAGEARTVRFVLVATPRMGTVRIEANIEGATVLLDGQIAGVTPYRGVVRQGIHDITVRASGRATVTRTVSVTADEARVLSLTLGRSRRVHRAWFWSVLSLTAAGAVTTGALGGWVLVLDGRYDHRAPDADDRQAEGRTWMLGTDIALGLTVAAAVVALVLGLNTEWHSEEAATLPPGAGSADLAARLTPPWHGAGGWGLR